jgi:serine/threonine protein kinase
MRRDAASSAASKAQRVFQTFTMGRPSLLTRWIHTLWSCIRWIYQWLQSAVARYTSATIELDTGRTVRLGKQIAEGGFSLVFEARDVKSNQLYALKRIQCPDIEHLRLCQREAGVHRSVDHPSLMPLLGFFYATTNQQQQHDSCCYMLFPYCTHSLRDEVNQRTFLRDDSTSLPPWNTPVTALQLFLSICRGIHALHLANYTHRDIKLENILFADDYKNDNAIRQPVIMDFGSVGPLTQPIADRRQVMVRTAYSSDAGAGT